MPGDGEVGASMTVVWRTPWDTLAVARCAAGAPAAPAGCRWGPGAV